MGFWSVRTNFRFYGTGGTEKSLILKYLFVSVWYLNFKIQSLSSYPIKQFWNFLIFPEKYTSKYFSI